MPIDHREIAFEDVILNSLCAVLQETPAGRGEEELRTQIQSA
jgi:hypothetical protein